MRISFRQMESSESVKAYVEEKIGRVVERYLENVVDFHVTVEVEHGEHIVHLHLAGGQGFNINLTASDIQMYAAIDKLHDTLENKLSRSKKKANHHDRTSIRNQAVEVAAAVDTDDADE